MWGGVFGGAVAGWAVTVVGWSTTFRIGGTLALCAGLAAVLLRPPEREPASSATGTPVGQD
jgi:OFA family oxalate/formate antiporter-like MFS transporter